MADDADARIRPYNYREDEKLIRLHVGKEFFEPLALANRKATTHYITLSVWLVIASVMVQVMKWWPAPEIGVMGYLRPLPAYAVTFLPIMFLFDWLQRPYFEQESVQALKRPDIVDMEAYYSRSPASGIWILEYGKQFVGLLAMDASKDSLSVRSLDKKESTKYAKGTSSTAVLRHFYVLEQYRKTQIQNDLLSFAVKHVFEASPNVQVIRVSPSPLYQYLDQALRQEGFEVVEQGHPVGLFRWNSFTYALSREKWSKKQN